MNKKILSTTTALSLSALIGVGALIGVASGKEVVKVNAASQSYDCSIINLVDDNSWCFRTLWTDNYGFSTGYDIDDFAEFVDDFYGSEVASNWDPQSTTRSWHRYTNGFNLCAGGDTGTYTFVFPAWVEYCSIEAQNNGNTRSFNYLNNLSSSEQGTVGSGYKKSSTLYAKSGGSWLSIGSAATTTEFDTTVSIVAKTAGGTQVASGSIQVNKYEHYSTAFEVSGYTFQGWYEDAALNTPFTGLIGSKTTLYAKMTSLPALSTPVLSKAADNSITWSAVANATKYTVTVDSDASYDVATSETLKVEPKVKPGSHTVTIKAIGDGVNYVDSAAASESYTIADGFFLVGSFQSWDATDLIGAERMSGSGTSWTVDVALPAAAEFKVIYANGSRVDWQGFTSLTTNPQADLEYPIEDVDDQTGGRNIKVTNAGNYRVSVELDNGSAAYTVLALDYVASYKLMVGSTEVTMTLNSGNEYMATGVNLTRGQVLGFKNGSTLISDSVAKVIYNNNLNSSKEVLFSASNVTVYVDVVDKTIFAEGLPNVGEGYHVVKNGSSIITMTHNENPSDPSYTEWYTSVTSFAANDVLTFLDKKASGEVLPVEFKITTINAGGLGDKFEVTADGIKAIEAVDTAIYLKLKSGADEVYFGEVSEAELKARQFASSFLTAINAVCDPQGVTTDTDDLADAWAGQVTAFGSLIEGAQNILKAATASDSVQEIRDFIAQYTYVLTKYGKYFDSTTRDFLNKGITPNPVAENHLLFTKDSTTTIAMVTIIAVVGLTAIGSVVYLRARKHQ